MFYDKCIIKEQVRSPFLLFEDNVMIPVFFSDLFDLKTAPTFFIHKFKSVLCTLFMRIKTLARCLAWDKCTN